MLVSIARQRFAEILHEAVGDSIGDVEFADLVDECTAYLVETHLAREAV